MGLYRTQHWQHILKISEQTVSMHRGTSGTVLPTGTGNVTVGSDVKSHARKH